jgi:hypothetical protein
MSIMKCYISPLDSKQFDVVIILVFLSSPSHDPSHELPSSDISSGRDAEACGLSKQMFACFFSPERLAGLATTI